jgi:hypothetical protein
MGHRRLRYHWFPHWNPSNDWFKRVGTLPRTNVHRLHALWNDSSKQRWNVQNCTPPLPTSFSLSLLLRASRTRSKFLIRLRVALSRCDRPFSNCPCPFFRFTSSKCLPIKRVDDTRRAKASHNASTREAQRVPIRPILLLLVWAYFRILWMYDTESAIHHEYIYIYIYIFIWWLDTHLRALLVVVPMEKTNGFWQKRHCRSFVNTSNLGRASTFRLFSVVFSQGFETCDERTT